MSTASNRRLTVPAIAADDCRARPEDRLGAGAVAEPLVLAAPVLGSRRTDLRVAVTLRPPCPAGLLSSEGLKDGANYALHVEDVRQSVLERRSSLQQKLRLDALQWLRQTHSTRVLPATHFGRDAEPEADAALSARPGAAVAVLTADCLPVVLWAEVNGGPVAVVHAGWQGLAHGIVPNAVRALQQAGAAAESLKAWIGPSICAAHYEVEADLLRQLTGARAALSSRLPGKRQLDLAAFAAGQLAALGVTAVGRSGWCSYGRSEFYSHRRAQHLRLRATGRMATLAWFV